MESIPHPVLLLHHNCGSGRIGIKNMQWCLVMKLSLFNKHKGRAQKRLFTAIFDNKQVALRPKAKKMAVTSVRVFLSLLEAKQQWSFVFRPTSDCFHYLGQTSMEILQLFRLIIFYQVIVNFFVHHKLGGFLELT